MKKKLLPQAFAVALSATAITKLSAISDAAAGAPTVELVALAVLPASPFRTNPQDSRFGIEFSYDAAALIASHRAKGRKLPLDIEHATEGRATDTRARGWLHSLSNAETEPQAGFEPGVLYAWVELTPLGKQELEDKLFGYTSAVPLGKWLAENQMFFEALKSLTLTNNPATDMPCNFTTDQGEEEDEAGSGMEAEGAPAEPAYTTELTTVEQEMLKKLLEKLGLTADTAEADALARVDALLTPTASEAETALTAQGFTAADVSTLIAPAAHAAVATQLTSAQAEVISLTAQVTSLTAAAATATAAESERSVCFAVDSAITARKATPAQRESLLSMARADLAAFTAFTASAPDILAAGNATQPSGNAAAAEGLTEDEKAFCAAFNFKESSYIRAKQQGALN